MRKRREELVADAGGVLDAPEGRVRGEGRPHRRWREAEEILQSRLLAQHLFAWRKKRGALAGLSVSVGFWTDKRE